MLVPALQREFGALAVFLLFSATVIPGVSARQIPLLQDSCGAKKGVLENIPSIGLGLWNSKGDNVSILVGPWCQ